MRFSVRSLTFKVAAPIPIVILLCVGAGLAVVPQAIEQNAIAQATDLTGEEAMRLRHAFGTQASANKGGNEPLATVFEQTVEQMYGRTADVSLHTDKAMKSSANLQEKLAKVRASENGVHGEFTGRHVGNLLSVFVEAPTGNTAGLIELRRDITPAIQRADQLAWLAIGGIGALCALTFLIALGTARSLLRPIDRICKDLEALAGGNLEREIPSSRRGDELGEIGRAVVSLQKDLREAQTAETSRRELQEQQSFVVTRLRDGLNAMAKGDLTVVISDPFPEDHEQLRRDYNRTVETLSETMHEIVETSGNIRSGAREISAASDDLAMRTESQAATLEETSAALDELTGSVKTAAKGAQDVETTMEDARTVAQDSDCVVKRAVDAMNEIADSSNHISKIVTVIDDIAFQTNLLALNAGIEAARAGEAGRGFAVVAAEVRALAQRSSDAAMEIKGLIGESADQVQNGVTLVGKSGSALSAVVGQVSHISGLISGIAKAAALQSNGLNEINIGVLQLDQVTQQNAAMVEESTAASHLLNNEAAKLAELVAHFDIERRASGEILLFELDEPEEEVEVSDVPPPPQTSERIAQLAAGGGGGGRVWQDF